VEEGTDEQAPIVSDGGRGKEAHWAAWSAWPERRRVGRGGKGEEEWAFGAKAEGEIFPIFFSFFSFVLFSFVSFYFKVFSKQFKINLKIF